MKEILKQNKAITLIALVITIVVLLILATITVNLVLGENGIIKKAKEAAIMHKKAEYLQEIELEITDEHLERLQNPKEELFIVSLQKRLQGTEVASQETVKVYTKKPWVDKAEINLRTVLVVFTTDKYQLLIDVDNTNNTAKVRENSFTKKGKDSTVTFNGNSAEGNMDSITITQGLGIELPENEFTKTNYTFVGWYEDEEGNGQRYNPGEAYIVNEDKTLYAKWSQHAITITYNPGYETETTMSNTTIEIGEKDNLLANTFERQGYTFAGWKDQDNQDYTNEQEIEASKDLELTAQWTLVEYSVTYNLDGGTNSSSNPSKYSINTVTITLQDPEKDGFTFTGWTTEGVTTPTKNLQIVNGSIGHKTFTANWLQSVYTINYNLNGGRLESGKTNPSEYTSETETFKLNNPIKEGYTFVGWSGTDLEGNTNKEVIISTGSSSNKSFIANWEEFGDATFRASYTKLEYIESTGSQYINTGIYPKSTIKIICVMAINASYGENGNGWGASASGLSAAWGYLADTRTIGAIYGDRWNGYGSGILDTAVHTYEIQSGSLKLDGTQYSTATMTRSASSSSTMYLFALHAGWSSSPLCYSHEKLYSCKMYDGSTLVRDFVPCKRKSDNKPGLYDMANNVFYTSPSSTNFSIPQ